MLVFEDSKAFGSTISNLYWQVHHKTPTIIFSPRFVCFQPWLHAALTAVSAGQICQVNEAVYRSSAKSGLCAGLGHLWLTPLSLTEGEKRIDVMLNRGATPPTLKSHIHMSHHTLTQRHSARIIAGSCFQPCLSVMFGSAPCGPWAAMTGMAGWWWLVGNDGLFFERQWVVLARSLRCSAGNKPRRKCSGSWGLWVNTCL